MERIVIRAGSARSHSVASPICGMCKRRFGGHNRDASGSSSFEASKPPKGIAGLVGIFMPVQNIMEISQSKAASHSHEDFMTNLWSNAHLIEQGMLWTFR